MYEEGDVDLGVVVVHSGSFCGFEDGLRDLSGYSGDCGELQYAQSLFAVLCLYVRGFEYEWWCGAEW